jgi:integrase
MSRQRQPKLCTHKASGLAYVTDPRTGTEVYFGPAGTPEAAEGYAAFCRELETWRAGATLSGHPGDTFGTPRRRAEPLTVAGLCSAFLDHAETYYRKGGRPTSEVGSFRQVIARLTARGGAMRPDAYGPKELAALRDGMAAGGMARGQVNAQVRRVCRIWKWAVAQELLPPERLVALRTVPPLKKGRGAREGRKVPPVAPDVVMATLPSLTPRLAALVLFQLHAGMRPGEAVCCRPCDVDRTRTPWEYRPCVYKTEHHQDAERVVYLGPNARAALAPWLDRCRRPTAWVWPSPVRRGRHYARGSYARAVATAVKKANRGRKAQGLPPLPHWHPSQLRHTAGTMLRAEAGIETAQMVLGHADPGVTLIYAESSAAKAREAAERFG